MPLKKSIMKVDDLTQEELDEALKNKEARMVNARLEYFGRDWEKIHGMRNEVLGNLARELLGELATHEIGRMHISFPIQHEDYNEGRKVMFHFDMTLETKELTEKEEKEWEEYENSELEGAN